MTTSLAADGRSPRSVTADVVDARGVVMPDAECLGLTASEVYGGSLAGRTTGQGPGRRPN
ncbi:hypothetical protein [Streptomyces sp. NPDC005423]|uniref:hypothetical protein n=1 Tax=Streptomyces sp. NPDC005423 TaxID=3155343 RepID=UPI0033A56514